MIRYIDEHYAVAPQLAPEHMKQLAQVGFRTVVNNRPDFEDPSQPSAADIEAAAREAGLHYLHIPVGGHHSADISAQTLRDALAEVPHPVLAFCRSGARSQMLYLVAKSGGK
jgi:uncharacterized protein (TIGR01244 family)